MKILLIVVVGAIAAWKIDLGAVRDAFTITSWGFLIVAILANFASVGFKGLAWKGVVDALPGVRRRTRYRDILPPLFIGFLFNTVLAARLGEIVKVMLLRRRMERRGERPPTTTLLGTVVAENLVSTITWVGLVVAIGIFLPLPSYAWFASIVLGVGCLAITVVRPALGPGEDAAAVAQHRDALGAGAARGLAPVGRGAREPPGPAGPAPDEPRGGREPR